ncbi:hypothetical protein AYI70_g246 [Smittium culicis]|uniref:Uncharacterized protein n=1 Tax=Smittium culicis TaxID=133412 RepID=A0A1R1YHF5_9FUNG|nr:hypothetical protein AYI70_g246 [Smittium culicis]
MENLIKIKRFLTKKHLKLTKENLMAHISLIEEESKRKKIGKIETNHKLKRIIIYLKEHEEFLKNQNENNYAISGYNEASLEAGESISIIGLENSYEKHKNSKLVANNITASKDEIDVMPSISRVSKISDKKKKASHSRFEFLERLTVTK